MTDVHDSYPSPAISPSIEKSDIMAEAAASLPPSTETNPPSARKVPLVPGAHLPALQGPLLYVRMAVFFSLFVASATAIVGLQIPSMLLLLHSHALYRSYVRLTEHVFASSVIVLFYICCPGSKLVLTGDFDMMRPKTKSVIICNHQVSLIKSAGSML
jgi:hypothetical protein